MRYVIRIKANSHFLIEGIQELTRINGYARIVWITAEFRLIAISCDHVAGSIIVPATMEVARTGTM